MHTPPRKSTIIAVAACVAGVAVAITLPLALAGDRGTGPPIIVAASPATSPSYAASPRSSGPSTTPSMSDSTKCSLTQQGIPAVSGVPCTSLTELFDSFCAAFDRGVDPREIFRTGQESFGKKDAQALMAMASATTCPQHDDQVTYDAVGWHP